MGEYLLFPERLVIRLVDSIQRLAVPALAVIVTIFARKKNDYSLARVSQSDGVIVITRPEVKASILQDKSLFLMDYASELEDCYPEIQIKICTADEVKKAAVAMEAFRRATRIDESLIRGFWSSQKHHYKPLITKLRLDKLAEEKIVELEVEPL